jgi:hypothetical protein
MKNALIIIFLLLIVGGVVLYILKEKKKGTKCIGCPYAEECSKKACCKSEKERDK